MSNEVNAHLSSDFNVLFSVLDGEDKILIRRKDVLIAPIIKPVDKHLLKTKQPTTVSRVPSFSGTQSLPQ